MGIGPLTLRYVPFFAMLAVAALLVLDARVRVKRPGRMRWTAPLQLLVAVGMLVVATIALIVSPEVGLLDGPGRSAALEGALGTFSAAALVGVGTLACGLAFPACPQPRRGLTVAALVVDGLAVLLAAGAAVG